MIARMAKISAVIGLLAVLAIPAEPSIAQFTPPLLLQNTIAAKKPKPPPRPPAFDAVAYSPNASNAVIGLTTTTAAFPLGWQTYGTTFSYNTTTFRDPEILTNQQGAATKVNGHYWLAFTAISAANFNNGSEQASSFGLAYSDDLATFTFSQFVSCFSSVPATPICWAPKGYIDNSGGMHFIVCAGTNQNFGTQDMQPTEVHPLTSDPNGAWSVPLTITGTALPAGGFDYRIQQDGSGTRYMFYVVDAPPGGGEFTGLVSSASDFSGYNTLISSNVVGNPNTQSFESPQAFKQGNAWYLFGYWNVNTSYATSSAISGPYSALTQLGQNSQVDMTGIFAGPLAPTYVTFDTNPVSVPDTSALHTAVTGVTVVVPGGPPYQGTPTVQSCSQSPCPFGITGSTGNWSLQTILNPSGGTPPTLTDVNNATLVINAP